MLCVAQDYPKCNCKIHKKRPYTALTVLILDCWQREYDKRPYNRFQLNRRFFEKRMGRTFNELDWSVLIEFFNLRNLKSVHLSYIPLPAFKDEDLMTNLVKGLSNVITLRLRGVSLPVLFLQEFHRNILQCKVQLLDLSENELVSDHLVVLRCVLIKSFTLVCLNVGKCFMNENTFPILADGAHKSRSLRCLDVSRPCLMTPLSLFDSSKFVSTVGQLIWQNKLTELHLRQCGLNGHDMDLVAEYLYSPTSKLSILDIHGNNIASHGTEFLFKALARSNTLQELNIGSNNLGSNGGEVVARLLAFTNLRCLNITHNLIPSRVMYEILVTVKKSCPLKELKLFGNEFDLKVSLLLKRLLRANVLNSHGLDVTYTWDNCKNELCVIPAFISGRVRT